LISYERLETLGDALLKYAMIRNLYCCYPDAHEGVLANTKSAFVSNTYLAHLMLSRKENAELLSRVSAEHTSRQFLIDSEEGERKIQISHKQLADIAEAVTGAIYLRTDEETAIKWLEQLGYTNIAEWDWQRALNPEKSSQFTVSAADNAILSMVEDAMGHQFQNRFLLPLVRILFVLLFGHYE